MCGDTVADVRVKHQGQIIDDVIEGAFEILDGFDLARESRDNMRSVKLDPAEADIFARSALALQYEPTETCATPVTESQVLSPRRAADSAPDLWSTFNRVQEKLVRGGLPARTANGHRQRTCALNGLDNNVKINRASWMLAEEMRRLKG